MANTNGPSKSDLEAVFNRLRAQPANKTCFDCNAKNPTWSSVTYGVFICIDCSAVHRNLGVHLTFVRSTNLDTNWTWIQLRQMQLGGNANAAQFFRQHNCTTTDAQQKYNSRAAQLYRDKLNTAAQQAIKRYGTNLFLESTIEQDANNKKDEEVDFFAECEDGFNGSSQNNNVFQLSTENSYNSNDETQKITPKVSKEIDLTAAPSVDLLNSTAPIEPPKSTIGVRKIQPKRGMAGAKKGGLGATKVKANFADIEQQANMADQLKEKVPEKKLTEEEEAETIASVRLAYQDLSVQAKRQEESLKNLDPTKAKQLERLGMGFNARGNVSHSAINDMKTIAQEPSPKTSAKAYEKEPKDDFFDDYVSSASMYGNSSKQQDDELVRMGFESIEPIETTHSNIETMFSSSRNNNNEQKETHRNNKSSNSRMTAGGQKYNTYDNDEAQKKFGTAKAISSEQFFNNEPSDFERQANLTKFQGSNSISSADYFGDGKPSSSSRGGISDYHYNGPDLDDVKESVRHGVTKVAGRLSSLASGVMSSIQDKYGN